MRQKGFHATRLYSGQDLFTAIFPGVKFGNIHPEDQFSQIVDIYSCVKNKADDPKSVMLMGVTHTSMVSDTITPISFIAIRSKNRDIYNKPRFPFGKFEAESCISCAMQ